MLKRCFGVFLCAALALPAIAQAHGGRGKFEHRGSAHDHRWSGSGYGYRDPGFPRHRFSERHGYVHPHVAPGWHRPYHPYDYPNRYSYRYHYPNRYSYYPPGGYRAYRYGYGPSVIIDLPPIVIR